MKKTTTNTREASEGAIPVNTGVNPAAVDPPAAIPPALTLSPTMTRGGTEYLRKSLLSLSKSPLASIKKEKQKQPAPMLRDSAVLSRTAQSPLPSTRNGNREKEGNFALKAEYDRGTGEPTQYLRDRGTGDPTQYLRHAGKLEEGSNLASMLASKSSINTDDTTGTDSNSLVELQRRRAEYIRQLELTDWIERCPAPELLNYATSDADRIADRVAAREEIVQSLLEIDALLSKHVDNRIPPGTHDHHRAHREGHPSSSDSSRKFNNGWRPSTSDDRFSTSDNRPFERFERHYEASSNASATGPQLTGHGSRRFHSENLSIRSKDWAKNSNEVMKEERNTVKALLKNLSGSRDESVTDNTQHYLSLIQQAMQALQVLQVGFQFDPDNSSFNGGSTPEQLAHAARVVEVAAELKAMTASGILDGVNANLLDERSSQELLRLHNWELTSAEFSALRASILNYLHLQCEQILMALCSVVKGPARRELDDISLIPRRHLSAPQVLYKALQHLRTNYAGLSSSQRERLQVKIANFKYFTNQRPSEFISNFLRLIWTANELTRKGRPTYTMDTVIETILSRLRNVPELQLTIFDLEKKLQVALQTGFVFPLDPLGSMLPANTRTENMAATALLVAAGRSITSTPLSSVQNYYELHPLQLQLALDVTWRRNRADKATKAIEVNLAASDADSDDSSGDADGVNFTAGDPRSKDPRPCFNCWGHPKPHVTERGQACPNEPYCCLCNKPGHRQDKCESHQVNKVEIVKPRSKTTAPYHKSHRVNVTVVDSSDDETVEVGMLEVSSLFQVDTVDVDSIHLAGEKGVRVIVDGGAEVHVVGIDTEELYRTIRLSPVQNRFIKGVGKKSEPLQVTALADIEIDMLSDDGEVRNITLYDVRVCPLIGRRIIISETRLTSSIGKDQQGRAYHPYSLNKRGPLDGGSQLQHWTLVSGIKHLQFSVPLELRSNLEYLTLEQVAPPEVNGIMASMPEVNGLMVDTQVAVPTALFKDFPGVPLAGLPIEVGTVLNDDIRITSGLFEKEPGVLVRFSEVHRQRNYRLARCQVTPATHDIEMDQAITKIYFDDRQRRQLALAKEYETDYPQGACIYVRSNMFPEEQHTKPYIQGVVKKHLHTFASHLDSSFDAHVKFQPLIQVYFPADDSESIIAGNELVAKSAHIKDLVTEIDLFYDLYGSIFDKHGPAAYALP